MENEKLQTLIWYGAFGYLGAILSGVLSSLSMWIAEISFFGWSSELILPAILFIFLLLLSSVFIGVPGGLFGGIMAEKRWVAFLVGFIPNLFIFPIIIENWYRIR